VLIEPNANEGRAVRVLLAAKGMTQADLAALVGVDNGTLSRVLSGERRRPELWRAIWLNLTSEDPR
jgi:transcriptional regulator with XRE-family HTH domain